MIRKRLTWLAIPLVCCLLFAVAVMPVSADNGAAATAARSISPASVSPGSTVTVQVVITAQQDLNGFILDEEPPAGWTVTPVQNAGATFNAAEVKWLWVSTLGAGSSVTVVYQLTIPAGATPGNYTVSGLVKSLGIADVTVGGANTIAVVTPQNGVAPAVGGTANPISRLPIIVLWAAIAAAIAGTSFLVLRRRRVQS